jgi:hypothetical protein
MDRERLSGAQSRQRSTRARGARADFSPRKIYACVSWRRGRMLGKGSHGGRRGDGSLDAEGLALESTAAVVFSRGGAHRNTGCGALAANRDARGASGEAPRRNDESRPFEAGRCDSFSARRCSARGAENGIAAAMAGESWAIRERTARGERGPTRVGPSRPERVPAVLRSTGFLRAVFL